MTDFKKKIITHKGLSVPIVIFADDSLMPSDRAVEQLETIARESSLYQSVVALPDIHDKVDNDFPTGVVVASKDNIFPQLLVSGVNCGMRLMTTPLSINTLKNSDIMRLFAMFQNKIRTRGYGDKMISKKDSYGILSQGASWILQNASDQANDLSHIENMGNAFGRNIAVERIKETIPQQMIDIARSRLGFLGKGNHFLEMQFIEEVLDPVCAKTWGLTKGQLVFLLHCGSGGFGSMVGHYYTPRESYTKELKMRIFIKMMRGISLLNRNKFQYFKRLMDYRGVKQQGLFKLKAGSKEAENYLTAINGAANFGYANRQFLANQIREIISSTFKISKKDIGTLYDMSHVLISQEVHNGISVWVHRCGATKAFPQALMPKSDCFADTGNPVFLPGSMGDPTYICVSQPGNAETFYSAGHGSGRKPEQNINSCSTSRAELESKLKKKNVMLFKGFSRSIIKQDPDCFKNVDLTLNAYKNSGLLKPIVKTVPVAVLKG